MRTIEEAKKAIADATAKLPGAQPPARFALLLRTTQDPVAKLKEIQAALATLDPTVVVRPLSTLDNRVLVAEFPDRVFLGDEGSIFEAAYALADAFDLELAEPDLPTNFFPQQPRARAPGEPAVEGITDFPPGCWAPEQGELKPRWALATMRVEEAWAYSVEKQRPDRGAGVIIAQPDTGVTNHPELAGVTQIAPRDVLDQDGDATDPLEDSLIGNPGHGTGTASVAISPESNIVAGIAPKSMHMPIRAIKSVLRITQVTVAEAIEWAVEHGAHVITMSLGGIPSFSLHRAVRRAANADVIVLAAAGNCVRVVVWPARYEDCIAVAGVDSADQPWRGTCRGSAVAISAPGQNVFRAHAKKNEPPSSGQGQGTSFAVALTAGVAALWLAHHGRANLIQAARARGETVQTMFRRLVKATARRTPDWDAFQMGAGIVDARALLEADLDAGRERESAPQPDTAAAREQIAVQSFVLETAGVEARQADLDWNRYGAEIAAAILRQNLGGGGIRAESAQPAARVSPALAGAVTNESMRKQLGLE